MISSDHGYQELRRAILAGELKPGDPLKERDLCAQFGISRTPIREALRKLVADGLAENRPRRSIVVSSFDETELAEIFELGSLLESHVAGLAAEKANAEDLADLDRLIGEMEALLEGGEEDGAALTASYASLDQAFHARIAEAARNSRIAAMLQQTVSMRLLSNVMTQYALEDFRRSLSCHHEIIEAIRKGDPDLAREAMRRHVGSGREAGRDQKPAAS